MLHDRVNNQCYYEDAEHPASPGAGNAGPCN
jgi:hypothetical protein